MMSIFKNIEQKLESLFEGFFNRRFRSSLQPVELARKLATEMDRGRQISVTQIYAPNVFTMSLSQADYQAFDGFHQVIEAEIKEYLAAYANEKGYKLLGPLEVEIMGEDGLETGDSVVSTRLKESEPTEVAGSTVIISAKEIQRLADKSSAWLVDKASGSRFELPKPVAKIGRKADNDVVLDTPSVSRYHARIEHEGPVYRLVDLESTNGTMVNGDEIAQLTLQNGDKLTFGDVEMIFTTSV